jgi:hypothetical protein
VTRLEDVLGRTREIEGDRWIHRFANGLVVHTDPFLRADRARVLPIGGFQDVLLNRLCAFPALVAGKRVFDPFSGSGVFGLMALRLGAAHVDFLDVNPRARRFQVENAERNGFGPERWRAIESRLEDFAPDAPYDLALANPPFVPTPPGIAGSLTSNGGADGLDLLGALLDRLDALLNPAGEAYVYAMSLVAGGVPLFCAALAGQLPRRAVGLTPLQAEALPFAQYADAYRRCFSDRGADVRAWEAEIERRHGADLGIQHYVIHVGPHGERAASWELRDDLAEAYCAGAGYAAAANAELALARVMENVVPPA